MRALRIISQRIRRYDRDGSGELDHEEFVRAIRRDTHISRSSMSDRELRAVFALIDADRNGQISCEEFMAFLESRSASNGSDGSPKPCMTDLHLHIWCAHGR